MYIYVTRFSKYPNLIKVGKSVNPVSRTEQLARHHGDVIETSHYLVGLDYSKIEVKLHHQFEVNRIRDAAKGDGATEFFSIGILEDVTKELEKHDARHAKGFNRVRAEKELREEVVRCSNLIGRLLGIGRNTMFQGGMYEMYTGHWEIAIINQCIGLGFEKEEVYTKYVSSDKPRLYTTKGRVALACMLSTGLNPTNSKIKALRKLLSDNQ